MMTKDRVGLTDLESHDKNKKNQNFVTHSVNELKIFFYVISAYILLKNYYGILYKFIFLYLQKGEGDILRRHIKKSHVKYIKDCMTWTIFKGESMTII